MINKMKNACKSACCILKASVSSIHSKNQTGYRNCVADNSKQFQDINSKRLNMSYIQKDEALDPSESIFPSNIEKIYFA